MLNKLSFGVILLLVVLISASEMPEMHFERHLRALNTVRHPNFGGGEAWEQGRAYVRDRMRHYGIDTMEDQVFNTTVAGDSVLGSNLIGIVKGANKTAQIIVVGVDYGTKILGNPLKDNTGGVACFLEAIHLFCDRIRWNPNFLNFTVIFVAFDLNTKEMAGDGMGKSGSYFFVHEWLLPFLNNDRSPKEFLGAIILDSVTTFNTANKTQTLPDGFSDAMPEADASIRKRGLKGDFLGFLYTSNEQENEIKNTFANYYNKDRKLRPFRLQEMELALKFSTIGADVMSMFNHQAHYYFWTNLDGTALPAFLLFDTDNSRADPTPDACVAGSCDVDAFLTKQRVSFMTHTTNTLVNTLLDLQTTRFEIPDSSANQHKPNVVFLLTFITCLLATVIKY